MSLGPESSPPEVKAAGCIGAALGGGAGVLAGPLVALGVRQVEGRLLAEPAGLDGVVATLVALVGGAAGAALGMRIGARRVSPPRQVVRPGPDRRTDPPEEPST